jgi:prepilin-type N-terminal cleavage/methylation domain-containing protein
MPPPIPTGNRAFTLVELVMVLVLVGVLAAVAAPRFARANANYRADLAARRIAADLAFAQRKARASSKQVTVSFAVATHSYQLVNVSDLDRSSQTYIVKLSAEPYGASLLTADFAGAAQVVFDGYGTPSAAGAVTLRAGGVQRTVTLDAVTGRATVQ